MGSFHCRRAFDKKPAAYFRLSVSFRQLDRGRECYLRPGCLACVPAVCPRCCLRHRETDSRVHAVHAPHVRSVRSMSRTTIPSRYHSSGSFCWRIRVCKKSCHRWATASINTSVFLVCWLCGPALAGRCSCEPEERIERSCFPLLLGLVS